MTLASERLVLRPVAPTDHAALHGMFVQPGVRRIVFDDQVIPPEQTAGFIATSQRLFETERVGLWTAQLKPGLGGDDVSLVGFGGLWYFRDPPELELLYGVGDNQTKRGYGREIARTITDYGFKVLGMREIRASTHPAHHNSRRVLDDLGFVVERESVVDGIDTVFYRKFAKG